MYLDYLKGKKEEVSIEISVRKNQLSSLLIKIREKERFIELLDKESTTPFTEFTPQVITAGDRRKREEISLELSSLYSKRTELEDEITVFETELENINSAMSDIRKTISNQKKQLNEEKAVIIKELGHISDTVVQDPMRASILIKDLLNKIQ